MKTQKIFISKRCGRIANRIVIFANFIAYAAEKNKVLFNYTFHSYLYDFESTKNNIHCRWPTSSRKPLIAFLSPIFFILVKSRILFHIIKYISKYSNLFNGITLYENTNVVNIEDDSFEKKISKYKYLFINGWKFRCTNYVQKHAEIIREYFKPTEVHLKAVEKVINPLKKKYDIIIGVHIRQGDYKTWLGGKHYFSTEEYVAFMLRLKEKFDHKNICFMITSNAEQDLSLFEGIDISFGPNTPVGDLYCLARCDYIIGPISTFSQWASFYGEVPLKHFTGRNDNLLLSEFLVSNLDYLS